MSGALHQASCVAIDGRALLIEGLPGSGKSSLVLALIDRGATLVGDDGVLLEADGGRLFASPAPAIAGKLEVRNVGLVSMPTVSHIPVALTIRLDRNAPRFIERADTCERHGASLPLVALWPDAPVLALRAEMALKTFGIVG